MTIWIQGIDASQNFIPYLGPIFCVRSDAQGRGNSGRAGDSNRVEGNGNVSENHYQLRLFLFSNNADLKNNNKS